MQTLNDNINTSNKYLVEFTILTGSTRYDNSYFYFPRKFSDVDKG